MSFPSYLSHSARPPLRQRMPLGRLGVLCRSRPRLCRMCPASGVTIVRVTYVPGGYTPAHRHAGSVMAYVTAGTIRSQLAGGPVETFKVGESFFEPPGAIHLVSENASSTEPAESHRRLRGRRWRHAHDLHRMNRAGHPEALIVAVLEAGCSSCRPRPQLPLERWRSIVATEF
jgi:hypothetical protein